MGAGHNHRSTTQMSSLATRKPVTRLRPQEPAPARARQLAPVVRQRPERRDAHHVGHHEARGEHGGPPVAGMTTPPAWPAYGYEDADDAVAVLPALRRFRTADEEMRRRMSADMAMNVSDLQALRLVITAERSDT